MKERIIALVKKLNGMRDESLNLFLDELDQYTVMGGSLNAITRVGFLNDLDRHITTLEQEIARLEALERLKVFDRGEINVI